MGHRTHPRLTTTFAFTPRLVEGHRRGRCETNPAKRSRTRQKDGKAGVILHRRLICMQTSFRCAWVCVCVCVRAPMLHFAEVNHFSRTDEMMDTAVVLLVRVEYFFFGVGLTCWQLMHTPKGRVGEVHRSWDGCYVLKDFFFAMSWASRVIDLPG